MTSLVAQDGFSAKQKPIEYFVPLFENFPLCGKPILPRCSQSHTGNCEHLARPIAGFYLATLLMALV
jgi:hypothetical protein